MGYYLKITFNQKTKKFIVRNPKQINIKQIKNIFTPPIPSNRKLIFTVTKDNCQSDVFDSEQKLIHYFLAQSFKDKQTVKISITEEKQKKSQSSQDQQFYQQFINNNTMHKTRSHSQQIQPNLITNQFNIYQTQQLSLYHSMKQNKTIKQEAKDLINQKQKQIEEIKKEQRQTDLFKLIQFLNRKHS